MTFHKGYTPWNKGLTKEENSGLQIISEKMQGNKNGTGNKGGAGLGENHWNWQDGKTSLNYRLRRSSKWKIWRELIFLRDNFTCQNKDCNYCDNKIGVMLHPHHIRQLAFYPELAFKVDNGITYCAEYHLKSNLHELVQKEN